MKIAFIIPSLSNNGPNVFTKILIEALYKFSFELDLDITVFYFSNKGSHLIEFPCDTVKLNFFEQRSWDDFDIVHTTMLKADLYAALNIVGKNKVKVISGIHNEIKKDLLLQYGWAKATIFYWLWRWSLKNINNVVVSSSSMKDMYQLEYKLDLRYTLIPYGISKRCDEYNQVADEFEILNKLSSQYTIIGSCGLLIPRKGFEQLISFLVSNPTYAVVIVGDGPEKEKLKNMANIYNVDNRFYILGFKDNSVSYYKHFDIYALTSYSEGFGLAMLDALSFSIPLVCSDLDIYKGFFDRSNVGLFTPSDISSLERSILEISKNIDYYKICSNNLYEKHFTHDSMAKNHLAMYKRLGMESQE